MPVIASTERLQRADVALLALFSLVLFGYSLIGGRVLTMHEARLPQASREMLADHDWLVPKCGGRPWVERPPLPHWITVGVGALAGRCDQAWIVRIPPALMGTLSVLLLAWIASVWFGRTPAVLSGLILATMFEFTRYAWLAEEDIFLATAVLAAMAGLVWLEFSGRLPAPDRWQSFLGSRPWQVWCFFLVLGLTNMVKGLLFGAIMVVISAAGYLIWNRDLRRVSRYIWLWGWLTFAVAAGAWIVAVSRQYPDMLGIWTYDLTSRTDGVSRTSPIWYYWVNLLLLAAPWSPAALVGLCQTWRNARTVPGSPERFLWCWALLPIAFLSLPAHKHHHYLVPCLAPWAILAAVGALRIREWIATWPARLQNPAWSVLALGVPVAVAVCLLGSKLPGPDWLPAAVAVGFPLAVGTLAWGLFQRDNRRAAVAVFGVVGAVYLSAHSYTGLYLDRYRADDEFLAQVRATVPADQPVYVNADSGILNTFRHLFYLPDTARTLHNLTFLQDERIHERELFVLARQRHGAELATYGTAEVAVESTFHQRREPPDSRWTLFRVRLRDDLPQYPTEVRYTALQVMERSPGPFLGRRP